MNQNITLQLLSSNDEQLASIQQVGSVSFEYHNVYEPGMKWSIETSEPWIWVKVTEEIPETLLYLKNCFMEYIIPFGEERQPYPPGAFDGTQHRISARAALPAEVSKRRNLSLNPLDQRRSSDCYPRCSANVETRGESVFAARNTIDGVLENTSHGEWPYQSWGEGESSNAEIVTEFGRDVVVDQIILYLRADFPHDNWWQQVTLSFSDDSTLIVPLKKTREGQSVTFPARRIRWVKMGDLVRSNEESPFPALTQWEVYGTEATE